MDSRLSRNLWWINQHYNSVRETSLSEIQLPFVDADVELYDKYFITRSSEIILYRNKTTRMYNRIDNWIEGLDWHFHWTNRGAILKISRNCNKSPINVEVVFWHHNRGEIIFQKYVQNFRYVKSVECKLSTKPTILGVIIRSLSMKRFNTSFPPRLTLRDELITINVSDEQLCVSKTWLISFSPIFWKMFNIDMVEQTCNEITIKEVEVEVIKSFMRALAPGPTSAPYPNPIHVMELLKLANLYQVDLLRDRCQSMLLRCVEISPIERLVCAEVYELPLLQRFALRDLTFGYTLDRLLEHYHILALLNSELLEEITSELGITMTVWF